MTYSNETFRQLTLEVTGWGETFKTWPSLGRYENGRLAIQFSTDEGAFGTATVNLPEAHLGADEYAIKNWSENGPLYVALLENGWLMPAHSTVQSGYVRVPIHHLAGPLLKFVAAMKGMN